MAGQTTENNDGDVQFEEADKIKILDETLKLDNQGSSIDAVTNNSDSDGDGDGDGDGNGDGDSDGDSDGDGDDDDDGDGDGDGDGDLIWLFAIFVMSI